jgi:hypothetical protein
LLLDRPIKYAAKVAKQVIRVEQLTLLGIAADDAAHIERGNLMDWPGAPASLVNEDFYYVALDVSATPLFGQNLGEVRIGDRRECILLSTPLFEPLPALLRRRIDAALNQHSPRICLGARLFKGEFAVAA